MCNVVGSSLKNAATTTAAATTAAASPTRRPHPAGRASS